MKKWLLAVVALALVAVAGFLAMRMLASPPDDLDLARSKPSRNGLYVVSIAPETEPVPQRTLHSWIATVTKPDGGAVDDAVLAVGGGMPQHGHGLPTEPRATGHLGEGRYRIEGVRFNMGGWWVLRFDIASPSGSDEVEFNISL